MMNRVALHHAEAFKCATTSVGARLWCAWCGVVSADRRSVLLPGVHVAFHGGEIAGGAGGASGPGVVSDRSLIGPPEDPRPPPPPPPFLVLKHHIRSVWSSMLT